MKIRLIFLVLLVVGLAAGCDTPAPIDASPSPESFSPAEITPYQTNTPLVQNTPTPQAQPTRTPLPLPSPTPFMYTVVANDTMIGIAFNFGITLDELMVANPTANPNALSIGTQLVIPLPEDLEGPEDPAEAIPEVLPLQTSSVTCYSVRSGGLWCFWLVTNNLEQYAENISGAIHLYNDEDEQAASQNTITLLNVLKPGKSIPLFAYFQPPVPQWTEAQGQLISAVPANQYETRYQTTTIENFEVKSSNPVETAQESQSITVSGTLNFAAPEGASIPEYAWVVAAAYDIDDNVVGIRRWQADEVPITGQISFAFEIYSLGKPIERVDILTEIPASIP